MRDSGIPVARAPHDPPRRPGREPDRLPGVRQAGAARLVRRHLEGARRVGARPPPSRSRAATTRRCSSRSSSSAWRSSAACSATACRRRSRRCRAASTRSRTSGTTTRRSTTKAAWSSSIPPELPQETIELVQQRAVDAFVASECEGMARVDFFVRDDGEVVVNELNTIPGLHRDERLREALRGVRHRLRRAARPADRARARAARAPLEARATSAAVDLADLGRAAARGSCVIQTT